MSKNNDSGWIFGFIYVCGGAFIVWLVTYPNSRQILDEFINKLVH